jgi:glycosidase
MSLPHTADMPTSARELDFTPRGDVFPSPRDWRDQVVYHLLIDRFDNAAEDLQPYDGQRKPTGELDPEQGNIFQGGQIRGITRRLDYIRQLGATTIWISPPFKNRSERTDCYHGYGIQNFLAVDPRFGTLADLQELVREAHKRGMYVVLDIIINHTANNWGYADDSEPTYSHGKEFPFGFWRCADGRQVAPHQVQELSTEDGVWPQELQSPDCYKRQGKIGDMQSENFAEVTDGDTGSMKDLDLRNPTVCDTLIRCFKWWIAQTDCDGYRIDTVKHMRPGPVSDFINAIREYALSIGKHNFLLYAEIVGDDELLQKYIGQNTPGADGEQDYPRLSACLDFPLYFELDDVVKGKKSAQTLRDRYERLQHHYRDYSRAGSYYVTFVDNHDQIHRPFKRLLNEAEDERIATLAIGYLLTSMGIPCIYYGTEQGFDGGGDTAEMVRECMFGGEWGPFGGSPGHHFNPKSPIFRATARLADLRKQEPALRYGRQYFQNVSWDGGKFGPADDPNQLFAYTRVLDTTSLLTVLNPALVKRTALVAVDEKFFPFGANLRSVYPIQDQVVAVRECDSQLCIQVTARPRELLLFKLV